jgi:hypothetical protein
VSPASRRALALGGLWLALVAALFASAAGHVERAGPYYDEAFMGQQAKDFFEPERGLHHHASTREVLLFGRPFPLRNAVYLGALKSQALLPFFAIFGPELRVMRLATLALCAAALGVFLAFGARLLGAGAGAVAAVLLATDPCFYFWGLYEWGPFSVLLLCRALGFWWLLVGWQKGSTRAVAAGGLALGVGVFGRADFAVVVAAAGLALVLVRPAIVSEAWRERRSLALAAALGLLLGAAPMLLTAADLLATVESPVIARRGDLGEKLRVLGSLFDGSRFFRVVSVGGRFDQAWETSSPRSFFGVVTALSLVATLVLVARRGGRSERRPLLFLLLGGFLVTLGMLLIPGAVRAHHLLNLMPLPHLLVGGIAAALFRLAASARWAALWRTTLALILLVVVASQLQVTRETQRLLRETGGRGRFSESIREAAALLEANPDARGISLDWGLHEPLLFLTRRARLLEPIWEIPSAVREHGRWVFEGTAQDVYLVHDRPYDLFGLGPRFLAAGHRLEQRHPGLTRVREHRDAQGELAFVSVQLGADHRLELERGFRIQLVEPLER